MASFKDPKEHFAPIEVVERLLEICEYYGQPQSLYLSSTLDLTTYFDSFGFDVYSLTDDTNTAFEINSPTVNVVPSGDKCRNHELSH
ncbi:MAG: hypothetical protein IPK14_05570 [Blastocatellia bacterium]|nr:hypothetical protein [Blastocatellia bacterium]MBL8194429.1 hypothetical protein [Blastocatellia bacterium]MBN8723353.1 hypothetical protein [Acidobacteriota bacterium]